MSGPGSDLLLTWLRAAGEPTRLRLLALCAVRELSVSDIAQVVGQSEPRVSRHLKILGEAGLIERLRQGQWVHYGLARSGDAAGFVQGLLGQLDARRPAAGARPGAGARAAKPRAASRSARRRLAWEESCGASWSRPRLCAAEGSVLLVGADHPELIETAAGMGAECVVLAHSRRSSQLARATAERRRASLPRPPRRGRRCTRRAGPRACRAHLRRGAARSTECAR